MSVYALGMVWSYSQHKGNDLMVLLAIADFANDEGFAFPGIEKLAKKARLSERQTYRIIARLEKSGEVDVTHRRNKGNLYQLRFDILTDNLSLIEETDETLTDSKSHLETDSAVSKITDSVESDDPSLTVIKPLNERDTVDGLVVSEDDIEEWFSDRAKNGVRSGAEELPRVPHTEEEVKNRVTTAIIKNQLKNRDKNPVIEMYLARVPEHLRKLASAFCYGRGRPPHGKEDGLWRKEWQDQYELGLTAEHIEDAFEYHRRNNLSVRSPVSVLTVAENLRTGQIRMDFDQHKRSETSQNIAGARTISAGDAGDLDVMRELMEDEDE